MLKFTTEKKFNNSYLILLIAFATFAAASTIVEINFSNFLRERYNVGEWFRGFLEFPRESQGFAIAFYVVLLGAFSERRLFSLAVLVAALGALGLAFIPEVRIADGVAGIVPALPLILFVMLHSAGQHMAMMIERAIVVNHGDLSTAGSRLGKIGFWKTVASLSVAGIVFGLRYIGDLEFRFFLLLAAGFYVSSLLLTRMAMRGQANNQVKRRKLILKRKFLRYYVLSALFGVRKQVFITFSLWVIVVIYNQPVQTIALLWVITSVTNLAAQPLIGRLIDRFGPRKVLTADAVLLCALCIIYGYGAKLFVPSVGIFVVGATYVLDHILFFVGSTRAVYVRSLTKDNEELSSTLSMGMTIDHVFSMTVPFLGGILWKLYGYEVVFLAAGIIAIITSAVAFGIKYKLPGKLANA